MTMYKVTIKELLNADEKTAYGIKCNELKDALKVAKYLTKLMGTKDYKLEITKVTTEN